MHERRSVCVLHPGRLSLLNPSFQTPLTAEYLCPPSGALMREAVIALDGVVYARDAIEGHFERQRASNNGTCMYMFSL